MSDYKKGQLVHELVEATRNGRISWEATANIDEFTTSLKGKYTVTVSKTASGHYILRMVDEADRELLNLEGERDEELEWGPGAPGATSISWLFELVRRTALHVDEAIDDILKTLSG